MYKSLEKTGKTIEDAINAALVELNLERDQVTVEVLEKPKAGFLGIGSTPAKVKVSFEITRKEKTEQFIRGLLQHMKMDMDCVVSDSNKEVIEVNLSGQKQGVIIGRHGDTLDSIQHITSYVVNRSEEEHVRVIVDVEGYRKRREETLENLAQKMAQKVMASRKSMTMEPMNAYERHVIHAALQKHKNISTHSVGAEPRRRVVVSYLPAGRQAHQTDSPRARDRRQ